MGNVRLCVAFIGYEAWDKTTRSLIGVTDIAIRHTLQIFFDGC